MPEGPSLIIVKENISPFIGKKIITADGNAKIDFSKLAGKKILDIRTWGKQLFIVLKDVTIRIHFLMFGSYSVNEQIRLTRSVRLHIAFKKDEIFFYTCSVRELEGDPDILYDWEADVMNVNWNTSKALKKLREIPETLVCDALLDQQIFSGVGNIIKNEVLFRIRVHPLSNLGKLPAQKRRQLVEETVRYSYQFLEWKKQGQLRRNWLAHTKKICPRDHVPFVKEYLGKSRRRTFYCNVCQRLYE